MKKLLITLSSLFLMVGVHAKEVLSYEIDPAATAAASWEVGSKTSTTTFNFDAARDLWTDEETSPTQSVPVYRVFLGVTTQGNYLAQDFYVDGDKKYSDPFMLTGFESLLDMNNDLLDYYEGKYTTWYQNGGKRFEGTYLNNVLDGSFTTWHPNGEVQVQGVYKNGELQGTVTEWYSNGQKSVQVEYVDGLLSGPAMSWYANGQKKVEGTFLNNQRSGIWKKWDENGTLIEESKPIN